MVSRSISIPPFQAKIDLEEVFPLATNFHVVFLNDVTTQYDLATGDVTGDVITVTGHNFVDGTCVQFLTAFGNVQTSTTYFVINSTANTFEISETEGGATFVLGGAPATISTVRDLPLINPLEVGGIGITDYVSPRNFADMIRREVSSYESINSGNRPVIQRTGAIVLREGETIGSETHAYAEWVHSLTVDNTGGNNIDYTHMMILTGGNSTPGDTTYTKLRLLYASGNTQTITAGQSSIQLTVQDG